MRNKLLILGLLLLTSCGTAPSASSVSSESLVFSSSQEPSQSSTLPSSSKWESTSQSSPSSSSSSQSSRQADLLNPADDPGLAKQYYLNHIGDIYQAWEHYRGDGVTIAVIDVGFKPNHEDFYYKDGTSKVSPLPASFAVSGSQVVTKVGADKVVDLGNSHGTFCAGVAAAAINGKGVVGVAPNATLMLLKTDAKPDSINAAFKYAADNGAKVVTISIGSYDNGEGDLDTGGKPIYNAFDSAVAYCRNKGTVVISAAGNGGLDGKPTEYTFPGATTGVIGVGGLAANSQNEIWSGSSYNSEPQWTFCDVFAPADGMYGCCHYGGKDYDSGWNGTSFASPQVAGMAALYFQKNPNATVAQFENALYASCWSIGEEHYGHGRVDVGRLLGLTSSGTIKVTVKTNWNSCNVYAWNLEKEKEIGVWPGKPMTKISGGYSFDLDSSIYEHVIFSSGSSQTIDISLSSFRFGKAYSLASTTSLDGKLIGVYA